MDWVPTWRTCSSYLKFQLRVQFHLCRKAMTLDELMLSAGIVPRSRRPPHRNHSAVFFHWDSLPADGRPASGGAIPLGARDGDDYGFGGVVVGGGGGPNGVVSGLRTTRSAESALLRQRPQIVVDGAWDEDEKEKKRRRTPGGSLEEEGKQIGATLAGGGEENGEGEDRADNEEKGPRRTGEVCV